MSYAVIQTGGKQYRVSAGDVLRVEKIDTNDDTITFDRVLMVKNGDDAVIGKPFIAGASVTASLVEQGRAKKVKIVKFRRRKHSMKQMGHRQSYSCVRIEEIRAA